MIKELEKYFKETPKEEVLRDWEATREFDNIPERHCMAQRDYSTCEFHSDSIDGCLSCGNYKITEE